MTRANAVMTEMISTFDRKATSTEENKFKHKIRWA